MGILGGLLLILAVPLAISYAIADEPRPKARARLAAMMFTAGVIVLFLAVVA